MMKPIRLGFGLLAITMIGLVGCSDTTVKKVHVNGTIAYKGTPLTSGILNIVGDNHAFATARIQADGKFELTDVIPGEVKVGVMPAPVGGGRTDSSGKAVVRPKATPPLPAKFTDPEKSGLKVTITDDGKDLVINME